MKNFLSKIFKCTRPGKPDAEEAPRIEGCVNPKIKENYNLPTKTSAVDYSDMFLPLTKNMLGKHYSVLSIIGPVVKYEVIACRRSTRWCVLSGLQDLKHTVYPSVYGY